LVKFSLIHIESNEGEVVKMEVLREVSHSLHNSENWKEKGGSSMSYRFGSKLGWFKLKKKQATGRRSMYITFIPFL
jgi:hypothetical protein